MSRADELFIRNCRDILDSGVWDTDLQVRPHWEDGAPAHTVKKFGIVNRYDLREEFPVQTIRRMAFKSSLDAGTFPSEGITVLLALIGILNFINTMATSVLYRKREFAMMEAVGMTGKQLNTMLVYEGLYYTMLSAALSLVLSAALGPLVGSLCSAFWFFTIDLPSCRFWRSYRCFWFWGF